jgi:nitrile hydratase accessory protein
MIRNLLAVLPEIPRDDDGPIFQNPWEAQAFAMVVALHDKGLFTWGEWVEVLAQKVKSADDRGDTYYSHWLAALEQLVIDKKVTSFESLHALEEAWDRAARATPHGQPIELKNDPAFIPTKA